MATVLEGIMSNIVEIFNIEEPYTNGITKVEFSVLNKSQILISVFDRDRLGKDEYIPVEISKEQLESLRDWIDYQLGRLYD